MLGLEAIFFLCFFKNYFRKVFCSSEKRHLVRITRSRIGLYECPLVRLKLAGNQNGGGAGLFLLINKCVERFGDLLNRRCGLLDDTFNFFEQRMRNIVPVLAPVQNKKWRMIAGPDLPTLTVWPWDSRFGVICMVQFYLLPSPPRATPGTSPALRSRGWGIVWSRLVPGWGGGANRKYLVVVLVKYVTSRLTPDRVEKTTYFQGESLEFVADWLEKNNLSNLKSVFKGTFILNC